ncbi:hypothetical protein N7508_007435 [Penicillium antarcticum]|uniref:uncharacterized protein n=1 Tax=Penicillium antarcticum TaxID=416450 RepID=UPI002386E2AF|nr:uncharacterized protein N7508_007386 [Penicillium antarcticum]XP_058317901.1 uncharacterized protein N7508_007435 [Penicillium antarcticum]KAJ5300143.1 hypothetical protein N7508_007386 [Penicillium antarcticum]KAJ5300192.1 hypothetical protein N7508_007435 [Penicillium antarcticum]
MNGEWGYDDEVLGEERRDLCWLHPGIAYGQRPLPEQSSVLQSAQEVLIRRQKTSLRGVRS